MTRSQNTALVSLCVLFVVSMVIIFFPRDHKTQAQPAPDRIVVQAPRPISDVACEKTYELDHLERFYVNGRVAVNFYFGGADRNLQPQYLWDRNVIGQSTEIRSARRVDRSLAYGMVTFLCLSDTPLEGHEASNIKVTRYSLTLRRPLVPQRFIRRSGTVRK